MKATRDNLFTDGARGSTRNMTITKRQSGRFIISARRGPNTKGLSPDQQKTKNKFLRAVAYAKATLKDTEKAAIYTAAVRPDFTAYTLAVTTHTGEGTGSESVLASNLLYHYVTRRLDTEKVWLVIRSNTGAITFPCVPPVVALPRIAA